MGAAKVDPAPLIVAAPPAVEPELELLEPAEPLLELELLLEPHAAAPSDAATARATAPMRRLLKAFSLTSCA
jgi:hypothetical protein